MGGSLTFRLKEVPCEMNIVLQKLLAHGRVVQTSLKHSITNTLPFSKKKVLSTKPSPELRLKVFRFFSRLQSWHSNQKEFVLVTFNGLLHVSLQNRHNKNQLRHTDRGCLSHVVAHVRERPHQKMCQYDALLVVLQASTMYALNGLKSIAAIVWQSVSVVK